MVSVEKFLFDRSFDEPGRARVKPTVAPSHDVAEEAPRAANSDSEAETYAGLDRRRRAGAEPTAPPPDLYTAAQLETAREEGYIRGHAEAREEAAKADGHVQATALRTIADAIDRSDQTLLALYETMEQEAIRLAVAITRRMFPRTVDAAAVDEIAGLVGGILPDLIDRPRLVIRVHDEITDTVREAVRDLQTTTGYEGRIVVRPDSTLGPADCRLEWGDGGIERDTARLWSEIEAAVERQLKEPVPPVPEPEPEDEPTAEGEPETETDATANPEPEPEPEPEIHAAAQEIEADIEPASEVDAAAVPDPAPEPEPEPELEEDADVEPDSALSMADPAPDGHAGQTATDRPLEAPPTPSDSPLGDDGPSRP
jgi:flagellar assembly protein FliH